MFEINRRWFGVTSSGAQATEDGPGLQFSEAVTFTAWVDGATDTAVIGIEHAFSSTSNFDRMGSTAYSISSGGQVTIQLPGPLRAVRPFVIAKTASTTVVNINLDGVSGA